MDETVTFLHLKESVANFVERRAWEPFHNPKDLAEAIAIEAAELLEVFQWRRVEEVTPLSPDLRARSEEELADVLLYCLAFANAAGIDLASAVTRKLQANEAKYPADKFRGRARLPS